MCTCRLEEAKDKNKIEYLLLNLRTMAIFKLSTDKE